MVPQHVNTKSPPCVYCGRYSWAFASETKTKPSGTKRVRSSRRLLPRITGTPSSAKYLELIFEPKGPATQECGSGDLMSSTRRSCQPLGTAYTLLAPSCVIPPAPQSSPESSPPVPPPLYSGQPTRYGCRAASPRSQNPC